ncbi:type II toxin-antitoxin system VapC family toxin [Candidatus Gottesmanbacteria bacterium]|nr:type II toxin-antitoxin system VapC family toxin [Candidatus Gottesmanbacteria bacterium]
MIVVDASVVYKWIIHEAEEGVNEALRLREQLAVGDIDVTAPDILLYEISNVLAHKSSLSRGEGQKAWKNFLLFDISFVSVTKDSASEYFAISEQFGISSYDAAYVALAKTKNTQLITADKKLAAKVKPPLVRLLV